jgi:hypothetical protein
MTERRKRVGVRLNHLRISHLFGIARWSDTSDSSLETGKKGAPRIESQQLFRTKVAMRTERSCSSSQAHLREDGSGLLLREGKRQVRDDNLEVTHRFALGVDHTDSFGHPKHSIFLHHSLVRMLLGSEHDEAVGAATSAPLSNDFDLEDWSILFKSCLQCSER